MSRVNQIRAVVGVVSAQVRHNASRTVFAIAGIALAVLALTLLASVGFGVLETGQQKFDASGRDLWLTGGPVTLSPSGGGQLNNPVLDAHAIATQVRRHENVSTAEPMAFQTLYVGRNASDLDAIVGVGVRDANNRSVEIASGSGFSVGDVHYGNGSYDGPMTREVIIGPQIETRYDVSVGDTLYIGGTKATAKDHQFRVVGVSSTFSRFLGTPTVGLHLSELQEISGTAGTDRATWITIRLTEGTDPVAVRTDIEREFPQYEVRTNEEQMQAVLRDQALIIAAAGTLVVLAVVAGIALTVNVLVQLVYHQRTELAALKAVGLPTWILVGFVVGQGLLVGLIGGGLGLVMTPAATAGLDQLAAQLVGFENLLRTPNWMYGVGASVAIVIGTMSTIVAGWQVARIDPLAQLHR